MSVKVQVRFEDELLERVDSRAGVRGRSQWIMDACRARLGEQVGGPAAPRVLRGGGSGPAPGRGPAAGRVLLPVEVAVRESVRRDVEPIVKGGK